MLYRGTIGQSVIFDVIFIHQSAKRYLPYHIVCERRQEHVWRDRPCDTDPCPNRMLEHIVIFHARDYKLQHRWHELHDVDPNATYIGFHTMTAQAAVAIAHSDLRPSSSGMLGSGAYFARSVEDTFEKPIAMVLELLPKSVWV
ncbi:unnamed protein product, partial [Rotaria sp. Silwood2]